MEIAGAEIWLSREDEEFRHNPGVVEVGEGSGGQGLLRLNVEFSGAVAKQLLYTR